MDVYLGKDVLSAKLKKWIKQELKHIYGGRTDYWKIVKIFPWDSLKDDINLIDCIEVEVTGAERRYFVLLAGNLRRTKPIEFKSLVNHFVTNKIEIQRHRQPDQIRY